MLAWEGIKKQIFSESRIVVMEVIQSDYFILFAIISIGIMVGRIKIKGFSLDVSAVIFVALVFGHYGLTVPSVFQRIGLLLFIYSVGIQAGPGFFSSFDRQSIKWIGVASILVITGALVSTASVYIWDMDTETVTGLLAGGLTSTPGLAAAIEITKAKATSIGYGVAYPFGVIGVMLFINLIVRILRIDVQAEANAYKEEVYADYPPVRYRHFQVENSNVVGIAFGDLHVRSMTDATISRIKQPGNDKAEVITSDTIMNKGAVIRAVGTDSALHNIRLLIGRPTDEEINLGDTSDVRWILVTNKRIVNKPLSHLQLMQNFNSNITRIKRSGIELLPKPDVSLKFGDKVLVVTKGNIEGVSRLLGNDNKKLSETDILPIVLGIVLGILVGQIPLTAGFSLGLTGGVLATALILSWIGKTGPVIWQVSGTANQLIRQMGLLFFLASVGTEAGAILMDTIATNGLRLFGIGVLITLIPMMVATFVGYRVFRINFLVLMGVLTGGMTSTPGLTVAQSFADTDAPNIGYATVYPLAMVLLILCMQAIALL